MSVNIVTRCCQRDKQRSELYWQLQNKLISGTISIAKPSNVAVFAFTYVSESLALRYGDFGMNSFSVKSDEAMKQGGDASLKKTVARDFRPLVLHESTPYSPRIHILKYF
jgi:hypothetical protein